MKTTLATILIGLVLLTASFMFAQYEPYETFVYYHLTNIVRSAPDQYTAITQERVKPTESKLKDVQVIVTTFTGCTEQTATTASLRYAAPMVYDNVVTFDDGVACRVAVLRPKKQMPPSKSK